MKRQIRDILDELGVDEDWGFGYAFREAPTSYMNDEPLEDRTLTATRDGFIEWLINLDIMPEDLSDGTIDSFLCDYEEYLAERA